MTRRILSLLALVGLQVIAFVVLTGRNEGPPEPDPLSANDYFEDTALPQTPEKTAPIARGAFEERMLRLADTGWTDSRPIAGQPEIVFHQTKQQPLALPPGTFREQLLHFTGEYERYGLADRTLSWSEIDCLAPPGPRVRFSGSKHGKTHGSKLYLVFARRLWPGTWGDRIGSYITSPDGKSPIGQVVVKESWIPEEVGAKERESLNREVGFGLKFFAENDGRFYRPVRKGDLFIMVKLDPTTPGTDAGWVYGTVTSDGKTVTSAGQVPSCMRCHQKAPHDRLFGLR